MNHSLLRAAILVAIVFQCFGQTCNPHPMRPSMLPPCQTIGDQVGKAVDAAQEVKRQTAQLDAGVSGARAVFWKEFPNGPNFAAAEAAFLKVLWEKDGYYLMLAYPEGMNGRLSQMMNLLAFQPGMTADDFRRKLHSDPRLVDGGINPGAYPLFVQLVNALRRQGGAMKDGDMANPMLFATVFAGKSNRRAAYEQVRNWGELESAGIDLAKYIPPKQYIQGLMQREVSLQLARANEKAADVPDSQAATLAFYNELVKVAGEPAVLKAAADVERSPRNPQGGLLTPFKMEVGTYVSSDSMDPYARFLTLLMGSPRVYATALLLDQYHLSAGFGSAEKWVEAEGNYHELVAKYGEQNVLAVAARLKAAEKSPTGGIKGDPQARQIRGWLDAALADPKVVIPDGKLPHFAASSFSPKWRGKYLEVHGTVSRVDLDRNGHPAYATIRFKESAAADGIMAYSPYSSMLQSKYGKGFEDLVGRHVAISGPVTDWREGMGVKVLDLDQMNVVAANAVVLPDSTPDWLTAKETHDLVDNPEYAAWKNFSPGSKVVYVTWSLFEINPQTDQYRRTKISRSVQTLVSIDEKRAVVKAELTTWNGDTPVRSAPTEFIYKAKKSPSSYPPAPPNESGDETLVINGKSIPTHWTSFWHPQSTADRDKDHPDPQTFDKTWTSDTVPGGIVRVQRQSHSEIGAGTYRSIQQWMIETVEGVEPSLDGGATSQNPKPTQSAPQLPATTAGTAVGPGRMQPQANSDLNARYNALNTRWSQSRVQLNRIEQQNVRRRMGLPSNIALARTGVETQLAAARVALIHQDFTSVELSLKKAEANLIVIENFVQQ